MDKKLVPVILLIFVLLFLPQLILFAFPPEGMVYSGSLIDSADYETYLTKMRIPAEIGGWLWRNWYDTGFNTPGAPVFLFYAALGKLARYLGVGYPAMFFAARIAAAVLVVMALSALAGDLGLPQSWRLPTMAALGGGLEWLVFSPANFRAGGIGPETYVSYPIMTFPHLAVTQASLAFTFIGLRQRRPSWLRVGCVSALIALIHPEQLAVPILAELISGGIRRMLRSILAVLPGLSLAAWETLSALKLPWVREWLEGVSVPPPDAKALIVSLSSALILAFVGFGGWAGGSKPDDVRQVSAWALVPVLLAYLPLPGLPDHRGRLLMGFAPWLWLFAAAGLERLRPAIRATVAGIMLAGPLMFAAVIPATLPPNDRLAFIPRDVMAAYQWLSERARGEVVLADPVDANRLPSRALAKPALAGHWAETPGYREGRRLAEEFFSPKTTAARRAEILRASGAKWVLWRADLYGSAGLEAAARLVWRQGEVEIWQVPLVGGGSR